jgi:hypothetical protein
MNEEIPMQITESVIKLTRANPYARRLMEITATKQRHFSEINIDYIESAVGVARGGAVDLAKAFQKAGLGRFIIGRKGAKSRFQWAYNSIDLAQQALGKPKNAVSPASIDEESKQPAPPMEAGASTVDRGRSVAEAISRAKESLSREIGVPTAAIEIKITL